MGYCTAEEVLEMLKDDMLNNIIGDDYEEEKEKRIEKITPLAEQAIGDAGAEIDGYLAKRYKVPFKKTPPVIHKYAKDIALYNLVSRKGVDEDDREKTYLNRYNAAIAFLLRVAEGKVDIDVSEEGNASSGTANISFTMESSPRLFTRESMKGW
ncbi:MAG: DUF1320 domain-containing protein [Roseburia sp.]|nr:DUF1320 domain-containing protein [Roseburia sp.]